MCKVPLKKSRNNVVVVIGDSVNTNNSIEKKSNIQLIGFASRIFNLAVKDIICGHKTILGKVRPLMVKLKKPIQNAKLNKVTDFLPIAQNIT